MPEDERQSTSAAAPSGTGPRRSDAEDVRAVAQLVVDATLGVTGVVQSMHHTIGGAPARLFSSPAYAIVRGVTRVVGAATDRALTGLAPLLSERTPGPHRHALLSALNGVLGDRLAETKSPLALPMTLFSEGKNGWQRP
jgi:hypothetical protein